MSAPLSLAAFLGLVHVLAYPGVRGGLHLPLIATGVAVMVLFDPFFPAFLLGMIEEGPVQIAVPLAALSLCALVRRRIPPDLLLRYALIWLTAVLLLAAIGSGLSRVLMLEPFASDRETAPVLTVVGLLAMAGGLPAIVLLGCKLLGRPGAGEAGLLHAVAGLAAAHGFPGFAEAMASSTSSVLFTLWLWLAASLIALLLFAPSQRVAFAGGTIGMMVLFAPAFSFSVSVLVSAG